ncbi:MAG: acetylornithine deacetylase [Acidiferrobacterales bacterium]
MSASGLVSIDMIKQLVSFDTTSRNSNLTLIEYIRDYLTDLGIDSHLTFDDGRKKANLYATCGPQHTSGVLLSGHTDCVPVDNQDWNTDPFVVKEQQGRLYGRGTSDMKSFIAIALAVLPRILERGLRTPVHFAFSYDEEIGCVGVHRLIAQLESMPVKPRACVVGEPTGMQVVTGHKGKQAVRCRVHGLEAHSALTDKGVNAVEIAAELVALLRKIGQRLREQGPFDRAFDPPFTTVHTGLIQGGTALNIVPKSCDFEYEIRNLPDHDVQPLLKEVRDYAERVLLPEMQRVSKDAGFSWERLACYPGLVVDEGGDATQLAKRISGSVSSVKVSFGTEGGLFQDAGIPTVVCGPGFVEQAHKPNEFIDLDQVARGEAFVSRLMEELCDR